MSERLKDCTAIITGGARGQGAAEARRFVEEGAFVLIADVLDSEGQALAKDLGDSAVFQHLDVTDEGNWAAVVDRLTDAGRTIDVLVNNAGILLFDRLTRSSREDFERVMDVNCTGVFLGMQAVASEMKKQQSGSIVNISSVAGLQGVGFQFSYSVSKWAVRGMTKSAAHELARDNIRVNSVHPGLIETAMLDQFPENLQPKVESFVPMGRSAEAAEVAELVLWLASNESSYCTGAEFVIDGGLSVG
ncbi:MAG TPA: 3-alpha-hydroxysteroid dehydrogenase [Acidimicrobiaceae bacterium]|jgi:3alpha(or 20beta)-hydroxysteroid dehydrogenase|nr:3-alpha-hydroxysteroid dehydrogenase [Acidimicrobiaceae bacterium]HBU40477.1 3-alpha-hydroxysteroid dehydrogenase [Acidimicrobiaceae bacterium]|tara:strand:+ start:29112 stop:29852 length:741 start_codon:yes stop_codon:yes gene_type:complete